MNITHNIAQRAQEFVAFTLGDRELCIDIMSVREIRGWTAVTPIPHSPSFVKGVINLRGTVLPIVDLGARLGIVTKEPTARHVIIVTQIGDRLVGLLVDAVSDILSISEEAIQPTPNVSSTMARNFVRGVLAIDGRMISIVTTGSLLPAADRDAA